MLDCEQQHFMCVCLRERVRREEGGGRGSPPPLPSHYTGEELDHFVGLELELGRARM